jgi:hypothetical protein
VEIGLGPVGPRRDAFVRLAQPDAAFVEVNHRGARRVVLGAAEVAALAARPDRAVVALPARLAPAAALEVDEHLPGVGARAWPKVVGGGAAVEAGGVPALRRARGLVQRHQRVGVRRAAAGAELGRGGGRRRREGGPQQQHDGLGLGP